jgi:hypothetical protein
MVIKTKEEMAKARVAAAMSKLNQDMRKLVPEGETRHAFLLAYCCSAGQE